VYCKSLKFLVISFIGVASVCNLTTIEASAQCGGIMCLIPNSAQDVYLTGEPGWTPPSNSNLSTSEQSNPSGSSGGGLMGLVARGAQDVYSPESYSEDQVLDEQSGFCVPKESEISEEQQVEGTEEQQEQTDLEQPDQQSFDDEGDGLDDNNNDDNSGNDEDDT
jgi:hypothetical protein